MLTRLRSDNGMSYGLRYGPMTLTIETVTPQLAAQWLTKNVGNRRLRESVATQYARDMKDGEWHKKPLAICFDELGHLGNGQHTLTAIVSSNTTQELLIARGVPRIVIALMDRGCQRSISEVASFVGVELDRTRSAAAKIVTFGYDGLTARCFSFAESLEMYHAHKRVIDAVLDGTASLGRRNSIVAAVCARAAYTHDIDGIRLFLDAVGSGVADRQGLRAAIRLREVMLSKAHNSAATRRELYGKAQAALRAFFDGKDIAKLYAVDAELFSVPAV